MAGVASTQCEGVGMRLVKRTRHVVECLAHMAKKVQSLLPVNVLLMWFNLRTNVIMFAFLN